MKRFLVSVGLLLSLAAGGQCETLQQAAQDLRARVAGLNTPGDPTWGQKEALSDLELWKKAIQALYDSLQQPQPFDIGASRRELQHGRDRFRVTASLLGSLPELMAQGERLEKALEAVEKRFDGLALPAQDQLANMEMETLAPLPYFDSPRELTAEARSLRLSVESLANPYGPRRGWGMQTASSSSWDAQDLYRLSQAAYDYENSCQFRYEHVAQTYRAFVNLQKAFDRAQSLSYARSNFGWRNIERSIEKLDRFYRALGL